MTISSTWRNVKLTIAADNTAQAPTDADLAAAGVPVSHATTMLLTIVSEAGNDTTNKARIGGPSVSATDGIGFPLQPEFDRQIESRRYFDVRGVYVSGKKDDVFNYAWEG